MKTVKMSLANMQGKMTRKEMKEITGGCGYRITFSDGTTQTQCGVSYATASYAFQTYGGNWCCSSCGSTSYCG